MEFGIHKLISIIDISWVKIIGDINRLLLQSILKYRYF